jgi:hypothetical protein
LKDYSQKTVWKGKPPKQGTPERAAYETAKAAYFAKVAKTTPTIGKSVAVAGKKSIPANELIMVEDNPNETDAERVLRISDRFDTLNTYGTAVTNGKCRSLIVSGAPGVGKTHTLERILDHAKEYKGIRYKAISGALTGIELYKCLEDYKGPKDVVMLDDADGIFMDENALSIMKGALDTKPVRNISWMSAGYQLKDTPDTFQYEGSMIFITNLPFMQYIDKGHNRFAMHMSALVNRAVYLDLQLHTNRDLIAWITNLTRKTGLLIQHDLSKEQQEYILDFMQKNRDNFTSLSIRTALKLANHFKLVPQAKFESSAAHLFLRGAAAV